MGTGAREAALAALEKCRRDGAWSGAAIDTAIKKSTLDTREAALASRLCLGVLQNGTLCDFYIDSFCTAKKLEPKVRDILRMGVYQLLFLDKIPARAAVNESVKLCRSAGYERASGLVNAILRRVSTEKESLPEIPNPGTAEHLSIKYSHPLWIADRLIKEHGYDFAESFLKCCNTPPTLDIQVNTLKISAAEYADMLDRSGMAFRAFDFPSGCIELAGGNVAALPGFDDGLFYVQDRAARLAAEIAGAAPGWAVLDTCSAPGGKAFASALRMNNKGSILACDIHEKKLGLIQRGAEKLGIDIIKTRACDAREYNSEMDSQFDLVIADVPCSGIGVIRKKPEIRARKESEIANLPAIQLDILCNAAKAVKPGGALLYSTCTVLRDENESVVERFLEINNSFALSAYALGEETVENGMRTFWPNVDGTDGFFAARLIRKK